MSPLDPYGLAPALATDEFEVAANGGVTCERDRYGNEVPRSLLDGGDHFDDVGQLQRQAIARRGARQMEDDDAQLPREYLYDMVVASGLKRPEPNAWHNKTR